MTKPDGEGGVVRKLTKTEKKNELKAMLENAKCCICNDPWDRYIGKKKCYTCAVPILICQKCLSLKPDRNPELKLKLRCLLCVRDNVTKPNFEVTGTRGQRNEQQY